MNHLRELLEGPIGLPNSLTATDMERSTRRLESFGETAVCFWMGNTDFLADQIVVPELASLPFDDCWFEHSNLSPEGNPQIWGYALQRHNNSLQMTLYIRIDRLWRLQLFAEWRYWDADSYGVAPDFVSPTDRATNAAGLLVFIGAFLSYMNCKNVQRQCVDPSPRLQKARAVRGKKPLFSYWTLHLVARSESGEPQGGTHASPRLHLRRGHPREYAPGQYTWVQPAVVGNKKLGMVHKDYAVGSGLLPANIDMKPK